MQKLSREQMVPEAFAQLELLKVNPMVLSRFKEGILSKTYKNMQVTKITDEEKMLVDTFEKETGHLVYYVIFDDSPIIGPSYSFFYVSAYKGDWKGQRNDLQASTPIVYVLNMENRVFSEYGSIAIECRHGVIVKMA